MYGVSSTRHSSRDGGDTDSRRQQSTAVPDWWRNGGSEARRRDHHLSHGHRQAVGGGRALRLQCRKSCEELSDHISEQFLQDTSTAITFPHISNANKDSTNTDRYWKNEAKNY
jgi:hypothetical protein